MCEIWGTHGRLRRESWRVKLINCVCLEREPLASGLDWRLSSNLANGKAVAMVCHGAAFLGQGAPCPPLEKRPQYQEY